MDTDRDKDIVQFEVQEENRKLVEEWQKEKLGKRAQRTLNDRTDESPEENSVNVRGE